MNESKHFDFLTELGALDQFLAGRRDRDHFVQPEDPDVRRLLEALAFFSARTHESATAELRGGIQRLAHGLLDEFIHPQPTRALLCAQPGARLTEPALLPRGSRVRIETIDGEVGQFSTMRDLTIRPLELDRAELQQRSGSGYRVLLRLHSRMPSGHIGERLSLHIDQLGDYELSRQLFERLREHLVRVAVVYGDPPAASEPGKTCTFELAGPLVAEDVGGEGGGVVARIREFFHFPRKQLLLDIDLARPDRAWRQAWLCLDLDDWPAGVVVNRDMFRLFVVPIENTFIELAEPIKCDGTRSSYPLRPWRLEGEVGFHSLVDVQQELASGLDPILPGHLATGAESYELDYRGELVEPRLLLRLPAAFSQPRNVLVRARWHQPGFAAQALGKLEASLQSRRIEGVGFRVLGGVVPPKLSSLWRESDAMLHVLSRRSKRVLSREDIVLLMTTLGADARSHHADLATEIRHVEVQDQPANVHGGGIQHVYRVILAEIADERRGLLADYLRCAEALVDAWSNNPARIVRQEQGRTGVRVARQTG